ncbi:Rhodanese-like domain-containing protein [Desulfonema limicola]|uniref:Rhodanese-like domain-containing protein n=1 Tax=Desulfonema limicola TaxID=45656 RepID=A0A975B7Y8_9BACT|nr:rhodanese-like domain-containing protein [Desulfonema limicola]QTA80406.1 Rhodanese-like domain-containing protein [Desulfonema limicola]
MKLISIFFINIIFLLNSFIAFAFTNVTVKEALTLTENNKELIVVDVREIDEFCDEFGHIPCSINYPYNSGVLNERYSELPKDGQILIVCRSGNRSYQVSEFLTSKGYKNIYNMVGGMSAWEGETAGCEEGTVRECPLPILYYPHIASSGEWETEIGLINQNDSWHLSGIFRAYDRAGNIVSDKLILLSAHSRAEIIVGNEFPSPQNIAYITFEPDYDTELFTGYLKFYQGNQNRAAVPAVKNSEVNKNDIYISHIASDFNWWTGIAIVNTDSSSRDLTIEFDNGIILQKTIAANAHDSFLIKDLFDSKPQADIHSGIIRGGDGLIGLELFGSTESSGNKCLSGVLLTDDANTTLYYPHVASDEKWWTGIAVFNPSDSENVIVFTPFRADGTALNSEAISVPILAHSQYSSYFKELYFPDNTAWILAEAESPVVGLQLFGTHGGNEMAGYSVVDNIQKAGVFFKIEKNGWTGIAFVNTEEETADIILTAHDNNGNIIASENIVLKSYEKRVQMAEDFFTKENIDAAAYIRFSSDKQTAAFQLNGSSDGMMLDGLPGR